MPNIENKVSFSHSYMQQLIPEGKLNQINENAHIKTQIIGRP